MKRALSKKEQPQRSQSVAKVKKKKQAVSSTQTVWRKELELLQTRRFATHEEACHAMFDLLARRLGRISAEERNHLQLLIETDPALQRAVNRLVRTKD